MVAGAAIGLGLGHAVRAPARSWGLGEWIGYYPVDAIFFGRRWVRSRLVRSFIVSAPFQSNPRHEKLAAARSPSDRPALTPRTAAHASIAPAGMGTARSVCARAWTRQWCVAIRSTRQRPPASYQWITFQGHRNWSGPAVSSVVARGGPNGAASLIVQLPKSWRELLQWKLISGSCWE